ncbi:hypothetical protein DEI92_04965 [Curtobacterium sp. MCBD17_034]|nr:hypothetical protein DEI92_04965 [Curtobacterium sp. MCBD17_034]PZM40325.1 hypothetical protein DEI90_01200 [Curtobacterium sp. MCBD17_031]
MQERLRASHAAAYVVKSVTSPKSSSGTPSVALLLVVVRQRKANTTGLAPTLSVPAPAPVPVPGAVSDEAPVSADAPAPAAVLEDPDAGPGACGLAVDGSAPAVGGAAGSFVVHAPRASSDASASPSAVAAAALLRTIRT